MFWKMRAPRRKLIRFERSYRSLAKITNAAGDDYIYRQ